MNRPFRDLTLAEVLALVAAHRAGENRKIIAARLDIAPATVKTLGEKFAGLPEAEIEEEVRKWNKYKKIFQAVFDEKFAAQEKRAEDVPFTTDDLTRAKKDLGLEGGNTYDLKYNSKGRGALPSEVQATAPPGREWRIIPTAKGRYVFRLFNEGEGVFELATGLAPIKVPDSLPSIVERYARDDEQALLARIRYNNLVSVFLGIAAYSLQSHWKTSVGGSPSEVDEIYVGMDNNGAHFVVAVEAKGRAASEKITAEQIRSSYDAASEAFPNTIIVPIAAKVVDEYTFAMIKFEVDPAAETVTKVMERHYMLAINPMHGGQAKPIISDEDIANNAALNRSEATAPESEVGDAPIEGGD